jgi:hypothetical protein
VPLLVVLLKLLLKLSLLLSKRLRPLRVPHLLPVVLRPEEVRLLLSLLKRQLARPPKLLVKLVKLLNKLPKLNALKYIHLDNNLFIY